MRIRLNVKNPIFHVNFLLWLLCSGKFQHDSNFSYSLKEQLLQIQFNLFLRNLRLQKMPFVAEFNHYVRDVVSTFVSCYN